MAEKLIGLIGSAPTDSYRKKNDDDFSDRLSSRYTVAILVMFAILVSMTQYVGSPIICWAPVHFHGSWTKFTTSYCWVKNTYYLPFGSDVPREGDTDAELGKEYVQFYQWIPFILMGQAVFFYFPTVIWHAFNSKGGVDADSVLESAHTLSNANKAENRENTLKHVVNSMDRFLKTRRDQDKCGCDTRSCLSATLCRPCGRRFGNYLVVLFVLSKLFYIANVICQFFLLDLILGIRFSQYGFDAMGMGLESSENWDQATYVSFPRVTLCDLNIRRLGNVNRYTVQCVLPINLYNEKIYLFLWFWMSFVLIVSVVNFVVWILRFIFRGDRVKFIKNHLVQMDKIPTHKEEQLMHRFLDSYLKQDGAFLLRLIAHNTNNITVTEIACGLWDTWHKRDLEKPYGSEMHRFDNESDSDTEKKKILEDEIA